MLSDVCLSDVCLSVAYIGPKSRTQRPRKTKTGTEVAHVTRDSDTAFKIKRSNVKVTCEAGAYRGGLPPTTYLFRPQRISPVVTLGRGAVELQWNRSQNDSSCNRRLNCCYRSACVVGLWTGSDDILRVDRL